MALARIESEWSQRLRRGLARVISPIDPWLSSLTLVLMTVGLLTHYSASGEDMASIHSELKSHAFALLCMICIAQLSPMTLAQLAVPVYGFGLLVLLGVAVFGEVSHGARRWLHFGIRIQPSEIMKIALPMILAWYFHKREGQARIVDYGVAGMLLAPPVALILKQPDLGTALLIATSGFFVLYFAGLSWRLMGGGLLVLGAGVPLIWPFLREFQRKRIEILLDPSQDPLGAGYHTIQAGIALGSGGFFGKGWLQGTQTHLDFLPEKTTDFVFAVFGEEFGLVGEGLLLILLLLLVYRALWIAQACTGTFNRLLAGSMAMTLFTYTFVNMGMVSGILPVVGRPCRSSVTEARPLPSLTSALGLLMSIEAARKRKARGHS